MFAFLGSFLRRFLRDERGLSFVMASVGMMALFGMAALVTDFGRIALARQRLVNAADCAALAGAQDLTFIPDPYTRESAARRRALEVAAANGVSPGSVVVSIDNNKISVDAQQVVELIMSRPFGVGARTVSAHAAAVVGGISSYLGIAPLCIREQPLSYGQICTLKFGTPDSPGNFGALALSGRGASNYRQNLINGFDQEVEVGDTLSTEPGNMSRPTDGINERLALCTDGCTYDSFRPGCPRILVIPTHSDDLQGRDEITVTGFAAFFVDRNATNCDSDEIKGYFVRMAADGELDPSQPATGLFGVSLVE